MRWTCVLYGLGEGIELDDYEENYNHVGIMNPMMLIMMAVSTVTMSFAVSVHLLQASASMPMSTRFSPAIQTAQQ